MLESVPQLGWRRSGLWLLVPALALAATLAALSWEHQNGPLLTEGALYDSYDVGIYFQRAQFYPKGLTPYVDVPSEYPVLSTLSFAAPYLFAPRLDPPTYALFWGRLMGLVYLATLFVVFLSRRSWGLSLWPVILFASPTLLYFTTNRFDIQPALVCCLSLYALQRNWTASAYLLLGIGVHLKWYPAVLFPVYLAYHLEQEGLIATRLRGALRSNSLCWTLVFIASALGLVGICILAFGWDGFLIPYRFHGNRGSQFFSLYWLAERGLRAAGGHNAARPVLDAGFLLAQVAFGGVVLWLRPKNIHSVFRYSVLAIVLFISFAKIDSPQWILWYAPIVLMFAQRGSTLGALTLLTLLNYLVFPVAFGNIHAFLADYGLRVPHAFSAIVFVKDLAVVATLVLVVREAQPKRAPAEPGNASSSQPAAP